MAVSKRKRAHKVSQGIHGATKHPLSEIEKALAGKGIVAREPEADCPSWRGVGDDQITKRGPWNAANVEENKRLYPHLFPELKKRRR